MNYTYIFENVNLLTSSPYSIVNMNTCAIDCKDDCKDYNTPLNKCNNAKQLFPGDPQWSDFDWYDIYRSKNIIRTFYNSNDGTCTLPTETFTIPLHISVGPIGLPRSCGKFTVK